MALVGLALLLGAGLYESVVLVPNFAADPPTSLEHFRLFMRVANPGSFFRVAAPVAELGLLVSLALSWRVTSSRWRYAVSVLLIFASDAVTFGFHYPRNHFLFDAPSTHLPSDLHRVVQEWALGNWVRVALVLSAFLLAIAASRRNGNGQASTA
jgi:uncharacterized membrane protein